MKIENLWRFVCRQSLWMAVPMVILKAMGLASVEWWVTVSPVVIPAALVFLLAGLEWLLQNHAKTKA